MLRIAATHWSELIAIFCDAFTLSDLEMLARFNLSHRLEEMVNTKEGLTTVCFKLIEKCDQRGETEPLLRGALKARPGRDDLRLYCERHARDVFSAPNVAALVSKVESGLYQLVAARHDPSLGIPWGTFRATFEAVQKGTALLGRYKRLHEVLHELQRRQGNVAKEAAKFVKKPAPSPLLMREAVTLKGDVGRARGALDEPPPLPTAWLEGPWIDAFSRAAKNFEDALMPPLSGARMKDALDTLRGLHVEAHRIDRQMTYEAARLPLDDLAAALTTIHSSINSANGAAPSARPIQDGRDALSLLGPQIVGRVREHHEWQWLTKELIDVESNRGYRPADKVPRWQDGVRRTLLDLCKTFEADQWAADLRDHV